MCPNAGYLSTNLFLHIIIISDVNAGKGPFNNYVDKMKGEGGQQISVFVNTRGGRGSKNGKILSQVVVEYPPKRLPYL